MSILECCISRWDDGVIMEADYSQLEVVYAAHIAQDETLTADILSGKDLHCQNASLICKYSYDELYAGKQANDPEKVKLRKKAKSLSFQLGYGAGAQSISDDTGIPLQEVKNFITAYYARYWRLKEWQDEQIALVKTNAVYRGKVTPKRVPAKSSHVVSETFRKYCYQQTDAPGFLVEKGIVASFSPTNIKNYPIQGGATGDIVPMQLGRLAQELKSDPELRDKALLINTVHDSVILDVHTSVLDKTIKVVQTVLEAAPEDYLKTFGVPFTLPLPCEVTYGKNWKLAKG